MPFVKTALVGDGGPRGSRNGSENISHFNAIRLRVIGQGSLKLKLNSLQEAHSESLADLPMSMRTSIQPTRLANFIDQRASLEIRTLTINDYFRINRILIFSKEFASEYPS